MTRDKIVCEARKNIGVPWAHQQATQWGMDCAGLLRVVHEGLGLGKVLVEPYERVPDGVTLLSIIKKHAEEIQINDAGIGDIAVFAFFKDPMHMGILSDIGMVHAWKSSGKVVEHSLDLPWLRRICNAFRFPGLEA